MIVTKLDLEKGLSLERELNKIDKKTKTNEQSIQDLQKSIKQLTRQLKIA